MCLTHVRRAIAMGALLGALAIVLAACGTNQAATPAAGTSTVAPTASPAGATGEGKVDARVTDLEVWQDYMPMVPKEGAPLFGVVSVEITYTEKITAQIVTGTVTLTQANGATVVSDAPVTLQQQSDDLGMRTPGAQVAVLNFGPITTQATLKEGEMIGGALALKVGDQRATLPLPQAALYFTH
jgi:hypothetical protein